MSAITTAAGNLDTTVGTLATQIATLVAAAQASQTTYQNANPGKYQAGLAGIEDNIRAAILQNTTIAQILKVPSINYTTPALATQYAAF